MEFNVLIIVSMLVSFVLTLLFGVVYIDFLKKKMYTQYILEDAPENHAQKSGTPTTGGVFIVLPVIAASIAALTMNQSLTHTALIVLITFLFFMLTGLSDDLGKIIHKKNKAGLTPRNKLFLQIAISILPALYMTISGQTYVDAGQYNIDLKYIYPLFAVIFITGFSNAVNLTDGIDGLASANTAIVMLASTIICIITGNTDLAIISAAAIGSTAAFLYFNKHPAKVFMGDTGSLALGGLVSVIAVTGKFELWILLTGIIFCLETLSVIIQVTSFKLTGKRVFKMSPIHHHFELCGWSENKIVMVFSLITLVVCTIAVILFKILW
ncbi:MAG: phospho-N-acetylmuramoyl-pentapeptide-transferase [Candidatus Gastranaerophilales bacterium]|nr:phospho-N-acetylmuramoyl-pentapeptide-transferase [Candidatus Gastranaerophilales bacterium]